jgi:hypothetical protein
MDEKQVYLILCNGRFYDWSIGLQEALTKAAKCHGDVEVYLGKRIAFLSREALAELSNVLASITTRAGGAEASTVEGGGKVVVVLDQMFRTFAEVLYREIDDENVEFHEILGRGIDEPVRISERLYQQPARDDYDILKLIEELASKHRTVIFFTGDKRLASQARTISNVVVEYLPPSEIAGKEIAIRYMKRRIREVLEHES